MADITVNEWLTELAHLTTPRNDAGLTSFEISTEMGISHGRVQKLLKQGVLSGKVKLGQRTIERDWDGRSRTYTVYSFSG